MAYNNLAYNYDNLSRIEKEAAQERERKKLAAQKKAERTKRKQYFVLVCAVIALAAAAYFMVSKNVQLNETNNQIAALEKDLRMLESKSSQKIFELEQSVDLEEVEAIAETRLNMQRPEKYQIVYMNVQTDDVTEVTADEVEGIKNKVGSITSSMKRNLFGIFNLGSE